MSVREGEVAADAFGVDGFAGAVVGFELHQTEQAVGAFAVSVSEATVEAGVLDEAELLFDSAI